MAPKLPVMSVNRRYIPHHHGSTPIGITRYLALYLAQFGWLALGAYLFSRAYWPSTCRPHDVIDVLICSPRLADGRGWIEAALMIWLWCTPLLVALELSRRIQNFGVH